MVINAPTANASVSIVDLDEGQIRMQTSAQAKISGPVPVIRTPAAVAGIRGTDLWASYETTLQESEVICFEHEISFAPKINSGGVVVKAGQWGGLGGRFGKTIQPPLLLPTAVLNAKKTEFQFPL